MRIYVDTIGCRLNQSEIEKIAAEFHVNGYEIVADPSLADLAIVNTCAVTAAAAADSRKAIRRIANAGCKNIIGTGCYATIEEASVADLPSVTKVVSNQKKENLGAEFLGKSKFDFNISRERISLPGKRKRTRAFIKVQDGCENHCTFCITRIARGDIRSQSELSILNDCAIAVDSVTRELVLTGVNLGSWGKDIGDKRLSDLVRVINQRFPGIRIRLSSIEPWDVTSEIIELLDIPEFCRHLHLPLQSGSAHILRKMGRKMQTGDFQTLIREIREKAPDVAITTDLMVGFPGETHDFHRESMTFIKQMAFADAHIFRYSPRKGTPAEKYPGRVAESTKKKRSKEFRDLIKQSKTSFRKDFLGKHLNVLWENVIEGENGYILEGLSGNYIRVQSHHEHNLYNTLAKVKITKIDGDVAVGDIIP